MNKREEIKAIDKFHSFLWAWDLIKNKTNWVVLDSETTGLNEDDQIIELAILSRHGSTIIDTLIKPTCEISLGAYNVHKISKEDLKDAPTFKEVYPQIKRAIEGKTVVIYNAQFDSHKLDYMCEINNLPKIKYKTECAMLWYAQYYGSWSDYWGNYKWQKLIGGKHRAKSDVSACWNLINKMAETLSCPVDIKPPLFPTRQIELRWEKIAEIKLYLFPDRKYSEQKYIHLSIPFPYFAWVGIKDERFPDDDECFF